MARNRKSMFIQQAIKKPGALRAALGAKKGQDIPASKIEKAAEAPGKLGQRARFALLLKRFRRRKGKAKSLMSE